MTRRPLLAASLAAVCAAGLHLGAAAQPPPRTDDDRPRLVVLIVVDQMRSDYIDRYSAGWTGGLKRLMDEGAWYRNGAYPYLNTVTCSGHATISTGRFPRSHGVIMNAWYDRDSGATTDCTADPDVDTIGRGGPTEGGQSAWRLKGGTLAERVRAGGGRVVTISMKPRAAIMPAGDKSDATIWFGSPGTFVTSTAYARQVPKFVIDTLDTHPIVSDRLTPWTQLLPTEAYSGADDGVGERPPAGWTASFPHPMDVPQFLALWQTSPRSDAYLARLASAAIDSYKLGQGTSIDFLSVSFSALDVVGHAFGPDSHEVQDVLANLDRHLGGLLAQLDERVGRGRYVLAFTADHGVAPIPERMKSEGQDAGRLNPQAIADAANRALVPILGAQHYVGAVLYTDLYFRRGVWNQIDGNARAVDAVKTAIAAEPGVGRVFSASDMRMVSTTDPVQRAAALSFFRERSGDIIIVPKRYWIGSTAATTHGTLQDYDQRVPMIFFGATIRAGRLDDTATPADIAPTLARLAAVALRDTDGHALDVPLVPRATPPVIP